MAFVKFNGYGRNPAIHVNSDRVVTFSGRDYPNGGSTELSMDDGSRFLVGHWDTDVAKMIEAARADNKNG